MTSNFQVVIGGRVGSVGGTSASSPVSRGQPQFYPPCVALHQLIKRLLSRPTLHY